MAWEGIVRFDPMKPGVVEERQRLEKKTGLRWAMIDFVRLA
jgi:hypothetical protein